MACELSSCTCGPHPTQHLCVLASPASAAYAVAPFFSLQTQPAVHLSAAQHSCAHIPCVQGCVIRRIQIIRRIVFNAYSTVLNKAQIKQLQKLPIFGLYRQSSPKKRPFSELAVLLHNISITYSLLEKN